MSAGFTAGNYNGGDEKHFVTRRELSSDGAELDKVVALTRPSPQPPHIGTVKLKVKGRAQEV